MNPRSILFVPGDRPDRFAKALFAGADAVCIDLEDAVAAPSKSVARRTVAGFLAALARDGWVGQGETTDSEVAGSADGPGSAGGPDPSERPGLIVRVNDPRSDDGKRDLATIPGVTLMIPKVRSAHDVERVAEVAAGAPLLPLIETVAGLEKATEIAAASGRVAALVFGGFDLAVELGAEAGWETLLYARCRVVHAAALAGTVAIDMPRRDFRNLATVRLEAKRARRLGFVGKLAIHPAQIGPIHEAFAPSAAEVTRARRIVEADRRAEGAAVALAGKMVDRPVVEAARRVLARAKPKGTAR